MKTIFLAAAACLILSSPALAMTDAECAAMWKTADANSDGTLNGTESERYLAMMRIANKSATQDDTITETMFQENCKTDLFKITASEPGAPFAGANSFTEAQAKDRVLANGLAMPGVLTKDENGIWRGTTMVNGSAVNVAVDYKGNVVAK